MDDTHHFHNIVFIEDEIVTIPSGYRVVSSGKLKKGDMTWDNETREFSEALSEVGEETDHLWCVIRKYLPSQLNKLVKASIIKPR